MSTTSNPVTARRRLPKPLRIMRARPRLFICIAVGIATYLALTLLLGDWGLARRILVAWDVAVAIYLVLAFTVMSRSSLHHIRRRAALQDEGQIMILVLTGAAALASLAAIFALLSTGAGRQPVDLVLATLTIVLSWAFTHTMFALHYAHEFHDENGGRGGGMQFPGDDPEPDYWDFMYFAFTIGMCAQVSDVTISCKPIRRTAFGHSVISFIFNAALLALTVNIAASAI
jgi:uncharacterized membrane protein